MNDDGIRNYQTFPPRWLIVTILKSKKDRLGVEMTCGRYYKIDYESTTRLKTNYFDLFLITFFV